ncbi:hypothetical protein L3V64_000280, partial [Geobacillus stearothermophilus]|uniref:hypothetical protein n=1 Tax=Geobacillus stearothermophilus TaxID=1422 RepID=UPI001F1F4D1B
FYRSGRGIFARSVFPSPPASTSIAFVSHGDLSNLFYPPMEQNGCEAVALQPFCQQSEASRLYGWLLHDIFLTHRTEFSTDLVMNRKPRLF